MGFQDKLRKFFAGRNGMDHLAKFCMYVALILVIITMFCHNTYVYIAALIFLGYSYFRMMSRNVSKRYMENQKYLQMTSGIRPNIYGIRTKISRWIYKMKNRTEQGKTYRFFKCPSCKQTVRVPKGHGRIEITCPKCNTKFVKKS